MVTGEAAQRAQIILIGAIAIAVVIVGLSVVANSFVFTQASGSTDVTLQSDDAHELDFESRSGVRSLVLRMNHRHRNLTAPGLATVVDRNVSLYRRILSESFVQSSGESVNITYYNDDSSFGARLVQQQDGNFTRDQDPNDDVALPDWRPILPGDRQSIGWFTMNVDLAETNESTMTMNVTNSTGHWVNYSINRTETGSGAGLMVFSNVSHAGNTTTVCEPSRTRVLLDVEAGEALSSSCTFNGTNAVSGPVNISIYGGHNVYGKYEIVANDTITSAHHDPCTAGATLTPPTQPCTAPVVWDANVSVRFTGSQVHYANRFNVSVYQEAS